jgi:hypothetical protein
MTETSQAPLPSRGERLPGGGLAAQGPAVRLSLLAFAAVVLASALLGVVVGFVWAGIAPRALLVVVSHGSADVVNPETSAFIAADGWFTLLCLVGGVISGLLGYLFAVRRHGAVAMLGVLGGAVAAALIARWIGQGSGVAAFNRRLAFSKPGVLLRAPLVLGAHGALAFWPLSAGITAGGIEAFILMRERRRSPARRPLPGVLRGIGSAAGPAKEVPAPTEVSATPQLSAPQELPATPEVPEAAGAGPDAPDEARQPAAAEAADAQAAADPPAPAEPGSADNPDSPTSAPPRERSD